jgi:hypothetical protein
MDWRNTVETKLPFRYTKMDGEIVKTEKRVNDKWTEDFEIADLTADGAVRQRSIFKNGVVVEREVFAFTKDATWRASHTIRHADGSWTEESSINLTEPSRREMCDKWGNRMYEWKVDGQWRKDYTSKFSNVETTYENGRLVKHVYAEVQPQLGKVVTFPTPETEEWGDGKQVAVWRKFELSAGGKKRLLAEVRDTDYDGMPDLKADMEKLTIKQPENPPAPAR